MNKYSPVYNKIIYRFIFILLFFFSYQIKNTHTQNYNFFKPTPILKDNEIIKKEELKILSWNIFMLPYIGAINNNSNRAKAIGEIIFYMNYDIVVFQEAFNSFSRKLILNELKNKYKYVYSPVNEENNYWETNSGIWVLSKIPLQFIKSIEFTDSEGFDAVAKKGAVMYEGLWNNVVFQLIGTHLQAEEFSYIRKKQLKQLKYELLLPNRKKNVSQIICGDFNINSNDFFDYYFMLNILNVYNELRFSQNNITYDELNNKLAKTNIPIPKTLDYILISNNTKDIRIEKDMRKFYGINSDGLKYDLSDHYALECNITF